MTIRETFQTYLQDGNDPLQAALLTLAEAVQAEKQGDKPLTVKQAADAMSISVHRVYELCAEGSLRHSKNPIRIRPSDIEAHYRSTQRVAGQRHLK